MNRAQKVLIGFVAVLVLVSSQCSPECLYCEEQLGICVVCGGRFELQVTGGCHPPTIDKCTTYGFNSECFRCQPTFSLTDGKCVKTYSGCITAGPGAECYQCGYNLLTEGTGCKGVINCKSYS